MNLPGFTAYDSLHGASVHYQPATVALGSRTSVVPATCAQDVDGPCINGWKSVCLAGGYPHRVRCVDCGPCVYPGRRQNCASESCDYCGPCGGPNWTATCWYGGQAQVVYCPR